MKKFTLLLFILVSLFARGQNGGQFAENNVAKIQYVSDNGVTATFWVISKQNCVADYKVDYGTVDEVTIAALDTAIFVVPVTTVKIKAKAELQTACVNQPDMGWVEIIVAEVLPVKLISFVGSQRDGNVILTWQVLNETVSLFEVERSTDGRNFTKLSTIYKVPGYGDKLYSITDHISSITYYRLKMYDDHMKPEYSRIITFRGTLAYKFKLYGNMITDRISFSLNSGGNEKASATLIDMSGRMMFTKMVNVTKGENFIDVPVGDIKKGQYIVIVMTESNTFTEKIIK